MRKFGLLALAASLFSTAVLGAGAGAADLPIKAPAAVVAAPSGWTGFYIGGNFGGGWSDRDVNFAANDPAAASLFTAPISTAPGTASFKQSGILGGLQLGYNWQIAHSWLLGAETDFDWSGMKGSSAAGAAFLAVPYTMKVDEQIKWFGTVRARAGYLPTEKLLVYVTGGFAYGEVKHTGSITSNATGVAFLFAGPIGFICNPGATCFTGSSSDIATGWTLGGGLEYAAWQNWRIKAEYLYVSLASTSFTETALAVPAAGTTPASFKANYSRTDFSVARVGLNYQF